MSVAMKDTMKTTYVPHQSRWLLLAAVVCMTASSGCTSVIGSAYLREAWIDAVEHAAETKSDAKAADTAKKKSSRGTAASQDDADSSPGDDSDSLDAGAETDATEAAAWSPTTLDEAVEEADQRLLQSGGLTDAARGILIATLKGSPRQDWPVVVEEFTAALAAAHVGNSTETAAATPPSTEQSSRPTSQAQAQTAAPVPAVPPEATGRDAAAAEPVAPMPPVESPRVPAPEPDQNASQPEPPQRPFAVQNACFASRVRAWGVVDRFETAEFSPGQEVIVYFELDQLRSQESADGHTTRIDTALRLVGADGHRIHEWTFEPLEETCSGHRRDYFARYLVALPASTPAGSYRLEIMVSDTIAGRTAHSSLPLHVVAR